MCRFRLIIGRFRHNVNNLDVFYINPLKSGVHLQWKLEVDSVVKDEQMRLIQDLQDFIHQRPTSITEFDETLVKRLIMKITVFEDHFTVEFKSGITIDIEA